MVSRVRPSPVIVGQVHSDKVGLQSSWKDRPQARSAKFMASHRHGCDGAAHIYSYNSIQTGTEDPGLSFSGAPGHTGTNLLQERATCLVISLVAHLKECTRVLLCLLLCRQARA